MENIDLTKGDVEKIIKNMSLVTEIHYGVGYARFKMNWDRYGNVYSEVMYLAGNDFSNSPYRIALYWLVMEFRPI